MNKETVRQLLIKANLNPHVAEILYPSMKKRYIDRNEKGKGGGFASGR